MTLPVSNIYFLKLSEMELTGKGVQKQHYNIIQKKRKAD